MADLKVAFIGDQGANADSRAVLQLIKDEGAHMVLHGGDFDYQHDPTGWNQLLDDVLGTDFPLFAAVGNHDLQQWAGYQQKLKKRLERISGASCSGDLGVKSACKYKGLFFVASGVGTKGRRADHVAYLKDQLAASNATWKICLWHRNQADMQPGHKTNQVGWDAYQACQAAGAIIATAHEHAYARTKTLTDIGNEAAGHGKSGWASSLKVGPGKTFVFVSGLGGKEIRNYSAADHDDDTWWATILTKNYHMKNGQAVSSFTAKSGALFITFNVDGDPKKAKGYFKSIDGTIRDTFKITKQ